MKYTTAKKINTIIFLFLQIKSAFFPKAFKLFQKKSARMADFLYQSKNVRLR